MTAVTVILGALPFLLLWFLLPLRRRARLDALRWIHCGSVCPGDITPVSYAITTATAVVEARA